jgi:hypothetical protein
MPRHADTRASPDIWDLGAKCKWGPKFKFFVNNLIDVHVVCSLRDSVLGGEWGIAVIDIHFRAFVGKRKKCVHTSYIVLYF